MAKMRIFLLLCFNILYVASYVENPVKSWTEPKVRVPKRFSSSQVYLPLTSGEAMAKTWNLVHGLEQPRDAELHCPKADVTLCARYDKNGRIIGVMITIPKDDRRIASSPYQYSNSPWFKLQKILNKQYYTLDIYFVSQDHLDDPGRGLPVNSLGETFRIIGKQGQSLEVKVEEKYLAFDGWERQNCESNKGTHYLHKINDKAHCQDLLPVVMLAKHGEVVGFSFIAPGTFNSKFFQKTGSSNFNVRFPLAPQCLKNWASKYKLSTLYMTFVPTGNIKKCQRSDHIAPPSFMSKVKATAMGVVNGK